MELKEALQVAIAIAAATLTLAYRSPALYIEVFARTWRYLALLTLMSACALAGAYFVKTNTTYTIPLNAVGSIAPLDRDCRRPPTHVNTPDVTWITLTTGGLAGLLALLYAVQLFAKVRRDVGPRKEDEDRRDDPKD